MKKEGKKEKNSKKKEKRKKEKEIKKGARKENKCFVDSGAYSLDFRDFEYDIHARDFWSIFVSRTRH